MRVILEKGNILLVISLVFSLWLLRVLRKGYKQRRFYKTVPCPPHSPFWGHLKLTGEIIAELPPKFHYQQVMAYIGQKYNLPSVFYLDMWPISYPMMIIQDPGIAAQITQIKSLPKHMVNHQFIGPLTGRASIVLTEGAEWRMIRSIVNPGFSPSYIASLTPLIGKHINKFTHKLSKAASTGEVFLLQDYLLSLTFDVISEVTLGFDLDSQRTFNQLAYHFSQAARWSFVPSSTLSPQTIASTALKWWHARQEGLIITNMIKQRCASRAAVNSADPSIRRAGIDLFVEAYKDETKLKSSSKPADQDPYFMEIALANVKSLLLGGHDTTSSSLSWIIALLSQNPSALARLRSEHDTVFGRDSSHTTSLLALNPSLLNSLPYTTACIKEALRIFPAGSTTRYSNPKDPSHPTHVTFEGKQLPISDQQLWVLTYGLGQRADLWPEPHKFIPERHLPDPPHPYPKDAWRTFEKGPRACVGIELAMNEMKMVLVEICRRFDFEVSYAKDMPEAPPGFGGKMYQVIEFAAKPNGHMPMKVGIRQ